MADYDFDMIKPVEGLQNVTGLNPAKRREERRRQRQFRDQKGNQNESDNDDSNLNVDISDEEKDSLSEELTGKDENRGIESPGIDFRA